MKDPHWIEYAKAVGAVATPILVLALTALGWRLRRRLERRLDLEDKLREDRIAVYNVVLEPFMIAFISDAVWALDDANTGLDKAKVVQSKISSLSYRQHAFRMSLVGDDRVVKAYNKLMQHFFQTDPEQGSELKHVKTVVALLGTFLLEVRRSMGNEETKLDNWEMLEWFLTDVAQYK